MPSAGDLNPHNTSTDLLKVNKGNPLLTPSHSDSFRFDYVFSNGKIRLDPYVLYVYNSNIVMPYSYMDGDVYVNTYQNLGHNGNLIAGAAINYNIPQSNGFFGNVSLDASVNKIYMKDMPFKGLTFNTGFNAVVGFRNVTANILFKYSGSTYSLYSKEGDQFLCTLHFYWQINKFIGLQLQGDNVLCGRRPIRFWTINGDYNSFSQTVKTTHTPRIQLGIWYAFQTKNFKWRHKKRFNNLDSELQTVKTE